MLTVYWEIWHVACPKRGMCFDYINIVFSALNEGKRVVREVMLEDMLLSVLNAAAIANASMEHNVYGAGLYFAS